MLAFPSPLVYPYVPSLLPCFLCFVIYGCSAAFLLPLKHSLHIGWSPLSMNPPCITVLHAQHLKWSACQYLSKKKD